MSKGQTGNRRRKFKNGKVKKRYKDIAHNLFDVADDKNVLEISKSFLEAQRKPGRIGSIAGVDLKKQRRVIKMEEKEKKKAQKQEKDQSRKKKSEEEIRKMFKKVTPENSDNEEIEEKYVDDEFKCNINRKEAIFKMKRNIETDTKIAETVDRFKISNDAAAHLTMR